MQRPTNRNWGSLTASGLQRSPYPHHLVEAIQLADGTPATIRPICRTDLLRERAFVAALSPETRYRRFMSGRKLRPGELRRLTDVDYHRELALVAVTMIGGIEQICGVARYVRDEHQLGAEFAVVVGDCWQRQGLGQRLLKLLLQAAVQGDIEVLTGITLSTNHAMVSLARKLGFEACYQAGDATVIDLHLTLGRLGYPAPNR